MKLRIDRKTLVRTLKTVAPAIGKSPLITGGVRLDVGIVQLQATCTNIDLTITASADADIETPGTVIVPAALFARIIETMAGDTVTLDVDDHLTIGCGETVATLHVLPVDEWPHITPADSDSTLLTAQNLADIARIIPMASTDKQRAALTCVHLIERRAEATDSYRAGMVDLEEDVPEAIIPAVALAPILAAEQDVTLTVDRTTATFVTPTITWTVRLMEGDYPNITRLVPESSPHRLTFAAASLVEAFGRVATLADDDPRTVKITIEGGKARLDAVSADIGTITDSLPVDGDYEGRIGLASARFMQMISAAGSEEARLELVDNLRPIILRGERFTGLIMPVKVT